MEAITTEGTFFDGISARPRPVTLRLTFRLEIVGEDITRDWSLLDLRAADAAPSDADQPRTGAGERGVRRCTVRGSVDGALPRSEPG
ncbi:hypothetical protein GCM10025880_49730 [Methylorubrum aminovorans]|nr:hypothetical protein GCM10025880_49730 [Methylorubrum aminovorans]